MTEQNDATFAELFKSNQEAIQKLMPSAEQLFFDALVHLSVGPFVAKISFANLGAADEAAKSVTTITVPTSVLTDLALNIASLFGNTDALARLAAGQAAFVEASRSIKQKQPD